MTKGNENMRAANKILRRQSGIALLTTILLMLLMSSMLVGFILLINSGQKLSGINNDYGTAFYGAEAGMEKLTADLGTLFNNNYAPPTAQINALENNPPAIPNVSYVTATGASGYTITSPNPVDANGNYLPTVTQISSGAYQGLTALATPYVMSVTARTTSGSEVKLQRTTQTVGIPLFQFGIFCQTDCAFYAGSNFNFGGRTHSNGNLFLASGATLTLSAPVSAYKDVITSNLENGNPVSNGYTGTVNVFNGSGTSVLSPTEGSLVGTLGSAANTNWPNISTGAGAGDFAGNLRNGQGSAFPQYSTGALQLNLGIVTLGNGTTQSIDVIRRPVVGEATTVTQERFYSQASLRVLLSDNKNDIINLPCISAAAPYNLADLNPANLLSATPDPITAQIKANLIAHSETFVPLAASGATGGANYSPTDGYWIPVNTQSITGYIKIEVQVPPYNACNWTDVTAEVLGYGYVGKNANPVSTVVSPTLPALPGGQVGSMTATAAGADTCLNGHPLAIIRLERIRDNPSTAPGNTCGATLVGANTVIGTATATDFWPNVLFDTREGLLNFNDPPGTLGTIPYSSMVAIGGVMQYIELDVKNVSQYLSGIAPYGGGTGHSSYDSANAPNDYVVYISDRRGNYYAAGTPFVSGWPPLSPSTHETGEYGFSDFANPNDPNGCPNNVLDTGEDLDSTGILYNYGEYPNHTMAPLGPVATPWTGGYGPLAKLYASPAVPAVNAFAAPPYGTNCGVTDPTNPYIYSGTGAPIWPGTFVIHANEARENPSFFFRRAVKLVNGVDIVDNMNTCPGAVTCGLTIVAENPIYIQGSYNCKGCTTSPPWNSADVGASVIGDAVTLLSDNWNDVNSFASPYALGRVPVTSYYRAALVAGKGVYFPKPTTTGVTQDYGTDGGAHNFLRYLEGWGCCNLNYEGSLVSLYFNRQGTGVYKSAGNVYSVPSRFYTFDNNFLQPSLLPPRTPLFRDVNTTGFTQLLSPTQ
jgi:Tfp pilus assembly protein PilX